MLGDGWYGSAFFCRLDEDSEGLQSVNVLIRQCVTNCETSQTKDGMRFTNRGAVHHASRSVGEMAI